MKQGSSMSIKAVLLNLSQRENVPFQQVITRYLHERLLFRVSLSEYKSSFVLKGGNLMYAIEGLHTRPTMDIDMLAKRIDKDKENIKTVFQTICSIVYENDCVNFSTDTIIVSDIAQEKKYSGVRLLIEAQFDSIRQTIQIDIGFGDVITPAPVKLLFPVLLNELESPALLAYSIETVISEKFEAMITLGNANSRMKDFFDVFTLLKNNNFNSEILVEAIKATFRKRNSVIENNPPIFNDAFYQDTQRNTMWNSFLRKNKLEHIEFATTLKFITEKIYPIYISLINSKS